MIDFANDVDIEMIEAAEDAEIDYRMCYFCRNEATTTAPIGPDREVEVCGLHS